MFFVLPSCFVVGFSGISRTARTNICSGKPPMISIVSLTIVFGTPVTRYLRLRSMNSVASIASAVMFGFAAAILCARTTALGQCGQVGVENTWMCVGLSTAWIHFSVSGSRSILPVPATMIASTRPTNS